MKKLIILLFSLSFISFAEDMDVLRIELKLLENKKNDYTKEKTIDYLLSNDLKLEKDIMGKKIEILKESRKVKQEILRLNTKKLELSCKEDFVQKKIDLNKKNLLIISKNAEKINAETVEEVKMKQINLGIELERIKLEKEIIEQSLSGFNESSSPDEEKFFDIYKKYNNIIHEIFYKELELLKKNSNKNTLIKNKELELEILIMKTKKELEKYDLDIYSNERRKEILILDLKILKNKINWQEKLLANEKLKLEKGLIKLEEYLNEEEVLNEFMLKEININSEIYYLQMELEL